MTTPEDARVDYVLEADPHGNGAAFEIGKGELFEVIGRWTVDFVAFDKDNLKNRFDQARTKTNQLKIFVTAGDVLISKDNDVLLTIVEDEWPWTHDMQKGMCSRKRHELAFEGKAAGDAWGGGTYPGWTSWEEVPARGCWENLTLALSPWPIDRWDIPSPLNIFQNMKIDGDTGKMWFNHPTPDEDYRFVLRAERDLVIGVAHHWNVVTRFRIYPA